MRAALLLAAACALAFAGSAADAGEIVWTPAKAGNGAFSVETPCTALEIAAHVIPAEPIVPGLTLVPTSRIVCRKDGMTFVAGVYEEAGRASQGLPVFDAFIEDMKTEVAKGEPMTGTPSMSTINGRRVWFNRGEEGGSLAQTGFVEIDHTKFVVLLGFIKQASGLKIEEQRAVLDRYYSSVKVTG